MGAGRLWPEPTTCDYLHPPTYKQELAKQFKQSSSQLLNNFVIYQHLENEEDNIHGKKTDKHHLHL